MRLEDYLDSINVKYETKYINGSKFIKIDKDTRIHIFKDSLEICKGNKCYSLPPSIKSFDFIKRVIEND